jgi:membrane dipeptidase
MKQLTEEQLERAGRLHRESLVVDTMAPFGPDVFTKQMLVRLDELAGAVAPMWRIEREMAELSHRALIEGELPGFWEGWAEAGVDVASVTIGAFGEHPFSYDNAIRDVALFEEKFDRLDDRLLKVTAGSDFARARSEGKRAVILNFQNAAPIGDDLSKLEMFHRLGLRIIQLTYNSRNLLGDGCTERNPAGLSSLGVAAVRQMNELGIMIDVSHCGERTSLEAIEVSERPVAVTHATARSVFVHDRGKSDDVIRAVGERRGYFGVVVVPFFLTDGNDPSLEDWLRHIERVVALAGAENVGIGTDWGQELPPRLNRLLDEEMLRGFGFRPEHGVSHAATVDGYRSWREWPNLTAALVSAGYSDGEIRGFLGKNFERVFLQAVG